jgi:hypothetical protein
MADVPSALYISIRSIELPSDIINLVLSARGLAAVCGKLWMVTAMTANSHEILPLTRHGHPSHHSVCLPQTAEYAACHVILCLAFRCRVRLEAERGARRLPGSPRHTGRSSSFIQGKASSFPNHSSSHSHTRLLVFRPTVQHKPVSCTTAMDLDKPTAAEQSLLLNLPTELQLLIFEFTVIDDKPLLLNCACDSSYPGRHGEWELEMNAWKAGDRTPPHQPAITQTCRHVRHIALPIFYKQNSFVARYCTATQRDLPFNWLGAIGKHNRLLLREVYLKDDNPTYDSFCPSYIKEGK